MTGSTRTTWAQLPDRVRARVEEILGDAVVEARSQPSGFSSGSADRVVCEGGTRAFVKTMDRATNPKTYELHRREAEILRVLPADVAAPRSLGILDDAAWVVLVIRDVVGKHPDVSSIEEITAVLDAVSALPAADSGRLTDLPPAPTALGTERDGWDCLRRSGTVGATDPWATEHLAELAEHAARLSDVVTGHHLVHGDLRADNLLIDSTGKAWMVDWPWAMRGAPWFDAASYLLDIRRLDPNHDVEAHLTHPAFASCAPKDLDVFLAALSGAFFHAATQPAPPRMPTIRGFQRHEAETALRWLRQRWEEA